MKTIIAGSRDITDWISIHAILHEVGRMGEFTEVVSGLARGPDMIGKQWAEACGIRVKEFRPAWQNPDGTTDKGAGMKRNALMAAYADRAVIFWDGRSNGTKNMINQAFKEQIETHVYFLQTEVLA